MQIPTHDGSAWPGGVGGAGLIWDAGRAECVAFTVGLRPGEDNSGGAPRLADQTSCAE